MEDIENKSRLTKIGDKYYTYSRIENDNNWKIYSINDNYLNTENDIMNYFKRNDSEREKIQKDSNKNEEKEIKEYITDIIKLIKSLKNDDNKYLFFNYCKRLNDLDFIKQINDLVSNLNFIEIYYKKNDYNFFLNELFKNFENGELCQVLNNISMIKILIDLKENTKEIEESSFIYEDNFLYQRILEKFINDFKYEYFPGLYDYIYFENIYSFKEKNDKKYIGIYEKYKKKYGGFDSNNNDNYSYIFLNENYNDFTSGLDKNIMKMWNKYIQNKEIKGKKLNNLYTTFDKLDFNDYRCRKKFYKTLFIYIIENIEKEDNKNEYLYNKIEFINAIIFLINIK